MSDVRTWRWSPGSVAPPPMFSSPPPGAGPGSSGAGQPPLSAHAPGTCVTWSPRAPRGRGSPPALWPCWWCYQRSWAVTQSIFDKVLTRGFPAGESKSSVDSAVLTQCLWWCHIRSEKQKRSWQIKCAKYFRILSQRLTSCLSSSAPCSGPPMLLAEFLSQTWSRENSTFYHKEQLCCCCVQEESSGFHSNLIRMWFNSCLGFSLVMSYFHFKGLSVHNKSLTIWLNTM